MVAGLVMATLAMSSTASWAGQTHEGWAKVRFVVGKPVYLKGGASPALKLERDLILHAKDVIQCDAGSHVDLILGRNNGNIQVAPNSEVVLSNLTFRYTGVEVVHDTQLELKKGVIYGQVNKMSPASKYEVKTPRGIAGIRGTRYRIADNGDVTVTEGTVYYSYVAADGSTKVVKITAGQTFVYATGDVRPATQQEIDDVNTSTSDAMNHGGYVNDNDPATQQFFKDARDEPFISPVLPPEDGGAPPPPPPPPPPPGDERRR